MKKKWKLLVAAVLTVAMLILPLLAVQRTEPGDGEAVYDENLILFDGWKTADSGDDVFLPEYIRPDAGGTVALENVLPKMLQHGTYLAVYSGQAYVTVSVGGREIYTNRSEEANKPFPMWSFVRLDPEYAGKDVRVEFSGPDPFSTGMISNILLGTYGELMMYSTAASSYDRWINLSILFMGLLVLLFSLTTFANRRETTDYFLLGLLIALFGLCGFSRIAAGDRQSAGYSAMYLIGRTVYGLLPALYCLYCANSLTGRRKKHLFLFAWISLLFTAVCSALWVFGPAGLLPLLRYSGCVVFCLVFGVCLADVLRSRESRPRRNRILLTVGLASLLLGNVLGTFTHLGETVLRVLSPETLGALVFVLLQTVVGLLSAYDHMERQLNLERELNEGKIRLMINQIKPHFINNVMTTIRSMIQYDPDEADEMVYKFNKYLVYNIDALSGTELCPFSMELTHIQTYLTIELTHLRPRLHVAYDIRTDDFEIPPLSVQPFVENAVKHGIAPKNGVGTLTIATDETEDSYLIRIADDGVGFDMAQPYDQRGGHGLGLNNAIQRLQIMVNGSVQVRSSPGEGTTVTVSIPKLKEEDFDEDDIG